jgi:Transposase DDE domain group 1
MGEAKRKRELRGSSEVTAGFEPMKLQTPGGIIHVNWDTEAAATPMAQIAFFANFLQVTGLYEAWVQSCPISYASNSAGSKYDILGTLLLAILAGHKRYAHITMLRSDQVSAQVLNMKRVMSEDAVRRALERMDAEQSSAWLCPQLLASVSPALGRTGRDWVLDIDTTIKPLYGKQEGAAVSYNPHKPGRPSHALHAYWVGGLRLLLDVVTSAGDQHSAKHARPGLTNILDKLPPEHRPKLVRGDIGFGNEPFIAELEARDQPYLFKLKQTALVKQLIQRVFREDYGTTGRYWHKAGPLDQGWDATEDRVQLTGWPVARRVIILRRELREDLVVVMSANAGAGVGAGAEGVGKAEAEGGKSTKSKAKNKGKAKSTSKGRASKSSKSRQSYDGITYEGEHGQVELVMPAQIPRGGYKGLGGYVDATSEAAKVYEYVVLVTNADYPLESFGQLYRDRADCENGFDELKNQWGWGGFSTQDINRSQTSARAVALVYNWWSWYCRAAHPEARMEGHTSRALLLASVGRITHHANQTTLNITPMHGAKEKIKQLIGNVHKVLAQVTAAAEQWTECDRWRTYLDLVIEKILLLKPVIRLPRMAVP